MKKIKILVLANLLIFFLFLTMNNAQAYSNESVEAKEKIENATICIQSMQEREIPLKRVNDSYQDASQLYAAQLSLEEKNKSANYVLVMQYAEDACKIKETALEAYDRLRIFKQDYQATQDRINLSSMDSDYQAILRSFDEERFEETLQLIEKGYSTMGETEKSQTTLKLFYSATTRSIKKFLTENWKKLSIIGGIILVLIIVFWKTLQQLKAKAKLRHLLIQRDTLGSLIKKLQKEYFEDKKISELEFNVKLERYKELIRDIDRQIPLVKETIFRLAKKSNYIVEKELVLNKSSAVKNSFVKTSKKQPITLKKVHPVKKAQKRRKKRFK